MFHCELQIYWVATVPPGSCTGKPSTPRDRNLSSWSPSSPTSPRRTWRRVGGLLSSISALMITSLWTMHRHWLTCLQTQARSKSQFQYISIICIIPQNWKGLNLPIYAPTVRLSCFLLSLNLVNIILKCCDLFFGAVPAEWENIDMKCWQGLTTAIINWPMKWWARGPNCSPTFSLTRVNTPTQICWVKQNS